MVRYLNPLNENPAIVEKIWYKTYKNTWLWKHNTFYLEKAYEKMEKYEMKIKNPYRIRNLKYTFEKHVDLVLIVGQKTCVVS